MHEHILSTLHPRHPPTALHPLTSLHSTHQYVRTINISTNLNLSLIPYSLPGGESFVEYGMCPRDASFPDNDAEMKTLSYASLNSFDQETHGQFFWNFRTEFEPKWDFQQVRAAEFISLIPNTVAVTTVHTSTSYTPSYHSNIKYIPLDTVSTQLNSDQLVDICSKFCCSQYLWHYYCLHLITVSAFLSAQLSSEK